MVGLFAMIVIRVATGVVRLIYFWKDISGFGKSLLTLIGFQRYIDEIPYSAYKVRTSICFVYTVDSAY